MQRPLKLPAKKARERLESKVLWNDSRNAGSADFFTFGYEGRPTDDIISALKEAGVETVIDIRFTPLSMYRPELSKGNFQRRTMHGHPKTWIIVGLFYPPKPKPLPLFSALTS